jgi:hypothetical protein
MKKLSFIVLLSMVLGAVLTGCKKEEAAPETPAAPPAPTNAPANP